MEQSEPASRKVTFRHYRIPAERFPELDFTTWRIAKRRDFTHANSLLYSRATKPNPAYDPDNPQEGVKKKLKIGWEQEGRNSEPACRGGLTFCQVTKDGEVIAQGAAVCSPLDNFSYRIGRHIAEGRALAELESHGS